MRKRIITETAAEPAPSEHIWLDLEAIAEVEVSSESVDFPIENALLPGLISGWRAAEPGKQTLRLIFSPAQNLHRIWLHFAEPDVERQQEYVLRWSADNGQTFQEIVRQQWNFNPQGSTEETEDHRVQLSNVSMLELVITPDISSSQAVACLAHWRLA